MAVREREREMKCYISILSFKCKKLIHTISSDINKIFQGLLCLNGSQRERMDNT
jgi:hypothetical protein